MPCFQPRACVPVKSSSLELCSLFEKDKTRQFQQKQYTKLERKNKNFSEPVLSRSHITACHKKSVTLGSHVTTPLSAIIRPHVTHRRCCNGHAGECGVFPDLPPPTDLWSSASTSDDPTANPRIRENGLAPGRDQRVMLNQQLVSMGVTVTPLELQAYSCNPCV